MRICTLASGSKGNCIYIEGCGEAILIDMGLTLKEFKYRANLAQIDIGKIKAILVTHDHNDHIKGVGVLSRALNLPVYAHAQTFNEMKRLGEFNYAGDYEFYENGFELNNFKIKPFRTPHDSCYSVGYRLMSEGVKACIATDLGVITPGVQKHLVASDIVLLESNHDVNMLKRGSYPEFLKKRILSSRGHLSNNDCAQTVKELCKDGLKNLFLAHLSEDNNTPNIAFKEVLSAIDELGAKGEVNIQIAPQYNISSWIEVKK